MKSVFGHVFAVCGQYFCDAPDSPPVTGICCLSTLQGMDKAYSLSSRGFHLGGEGTVRSRVVHSESRIRDAESRQRFRQDRAHWPCRIF